MIRELKEHHLQDAPFEEIRSMLCEYVGPRTASAADIQAAAIEIDRIRKRSPHVRALIAGYLQSNELFCSECGETSCVHGYPDI